MSHTLFPDETIRSLSWNQPFASLMLHGKIETRNRPTKVRGKVLICACKKRYTRQTVVAISGNRQFEKIYSKYPAGLFPVGCTIAIGDLVDCRPMTPADEDKCFVAYRPGLWCWVFENVQAIEPFPIKGKQGWSIITDDIKKQIKLKAV